MRKKKQLDFKAKRNQKSLHAGGGKQKDKHTVVRYIKPKIKDFEEKETIGLQGKKKPKVTPRWWKETKKGME